MEQISFYLKLTGAGKTHTGRQGGDQPVRAGILLLDWLTYKYQEYGYAGQPGSEREQRCQLSAP